MYEMIRVIRLKRVVVNERMCLKGVPEIEQRTVHDKTMQRPLKKRGEDDASRKAHGRPEDQFLDKQHNYELNDNFLPANPATTQVYPRKLPKVSAPKQLNSCHNLVANYR
jgi:hypothetical protein